MSHTRSFTLVQGLAAASVAAVVLVMLTPLRPGTPLAGDAREASMIPLLASNGLADSGAFHRLQYKPAPCASSAPVFEKRISGSTGDRGLRVVTVRKKVLPLPVNLGAPRESWAHLTPGVRDGIDSGTGHARDAGLLVIHGSGGSRVTNLAAMSRLHRRVLGGASGVAYDFVIGTEKSPTEILVGDRWQQRDEESDEVQICLMGDFDQVGPSADQLAALDELIDYLRVRLGHWRVTTHARQVGRPVSCMGPGFPESAILEALNPRS